MSSVSTIQYGSELDQYGEFTVPLGAHSDPMPTYVLIHGGFWRDDRTLALMRPLAQHLASAGFCVWNVEYRRSGPRHSWPEALVDVAAALDFLAVITARIGPPYLRLDLENVIVMGHSAGGYLALWLGCHFNDQRAENTDTEPNPTVGWAVGLAAVTDLSVAAVEGLGDAAVIDFVGGTPSEEPSRYTHARLEPSSPSTRFHLVHGEWDDVVPLDHSIRFQRDHSKAVVLDRVESDHIALIDPDCEAMKPAIARILSHARNTTNQPRR